MDEYKRDEEDSINELDSHVNMVVVVKHVTIFADTGTTTDMRPFTPDYQDMAKVSILDAEFQYICQCMGKVYVIVFRNALSVPIIYNNLIPLFMMR